jgi:thiol-disulfide isomerase/thioredoxin
VFKTFVVLCFVIMGTGCGGTLPGSASHPYLNRQVQPLTEGDLTNTTMVSVPTPGKVTVAYFWATFCEPCKKTMPELETLYRTRGTDELVLVGLSKDDNPGVVASYLKSTNISFPIVLDGQAGQFFGHYQCDEMPTTLVFDRSGKLRMVTRGKDKGLKKLNSALDALL